MHYKNGREAKVGDTIVHPVWHGGKYHAGLGILIQATPGSDTCNGGVIPIGTNTTSVNLKDCLHVDDVTPGTDNPAKAVALPLKAQDEVAGKETTGGA